MAIIQAPACCYCNLHFPNSSSSIPIRNRISTSPSHSFLTSSINTTTRKYFTTSCSLLDDGISGSAVQAIEIDPMLAVKKKAMEVSPGLKGTSLYLVGINSTMKTRVGKLLADVLRYYYFDRYFFFFFKFDQVRVIIVKTCQLECSDNLVVEAAGGEDGVKQLLDMDKAGFRASETEVLRQLSSMGRMVVSAGDGAVQSSTNLSLLRHGISIWIDVPLDIVAKEILEDGVRLIGTEISLSASHSEVVSQLAVISEELRKGYAIADTTISLEKVAGLLGYDDLEAVSPEDMGLEVLTELEKLIRVKKMMEDAARPF
ncbi:probable inactive shikimate kinase like 1, chloroplastic isoform X1 [Rutidosis leptorrhynchoides]|uniref:probable inactive shikimate kinase like 1, chloroplastic isoform X1 n=1 Tax=Rutidosis leptorrhynchoides TaxID=125765 RepID=UPI003A99E292